ncbi:MAG: O-antigen ligase family protein [Gammaproteobacteria bacterium]|nr:O-antigen ligase family protein [Gammaproteobacteria bacterium]
MTPSSSNQPAGNVFQDGATPFAAPLLFAGFCLFILLTPLFDLVPGLGMYNEKRVLELGLLMLGATLLLTSRALHRGWLNIFVSLPASVKITLFTLMMLGLTSAWFSRLPVWAVIDVATYVLITITTLSFAAACRQLPQWVDKILAATLLAVMTGYSIQFISGLIAAFTNPAIGLIQSALFSNFAHVRFFSQFQSWLLPLSILPVLLLSRPSKWGIKYLAAAATTAWWFMLFTSGTRASLLALPVAAILVITFYRRAAWPWLRWMLLTAATGLIVYLMVFFVLPTLTHTTSTASVITNTVGRDLTDSSGRWILWQRAIEMIQQHPLLGVGPMHYACDPTNHIAAHPHNSTLQIAAEWGLPALLVMVFILGYGIVSWLQRSRTHPLPEPGQTLKIALLASLLTAAVHAQFCGILIMPLSQVMLMVVVGRMLSQHLNPAAGLDHIPAYATPALFIICAATLLTIVIFVLPQIPTLEHWQSDIQLHGYALEPRFWQQGRLCDDLG